MHGALMTKDRRKTKAVTLPTARPRTMQVTVVHPTVPLAVEKVERVVDPIETMRKRKQLSHWQHRAAERVRGAHDVLYGSIGGVMDMDRVRGGGDPSAHPPLSYLEAANTISDIKRWLYGRDHRLVQFIVCEGHGIREAASLMARRTATRAEEEDVGRRLRAALDELAAKWWGSSGQESDGTRGKIVTYHTLEASPAAKPYTAAEGMIARGKTVHATGHRVFRNK
jgi:hypothetical protein